MQTAGIVLLNDEARSARDSLRARLLCAARLRGDGEVALAFIFSQAHLPIRFHPGNENATAIGQITVATTSAAKRSRRKTSPNDEICSSPWAPRLLPLLR